MPMETWSDCGTSNNYRPRYIWSRYTNRSKKILSTPSGTEGKRDLPVGCRDSHKCRGNGPAYGPGAYNVDSVMIHCPVSCNRCSKSLKHNSKISFYELKPEITASPKNKGQTWIPAAQMTLSSNCVHSTRMPNFPNSHATLPTTFLDGHAVIWPKFILFYFIFIWPNAAFQRQSKWCADREVEDIILQVKAVPHLTEIERIMFDPTSLLHLC